jgi:hypothetical protein
MAAYCGCCGAEITGVAEVCAACGAPRHGMMPADFSLGKANDSGPPDGKDPLPAEECPSQ